MPAVSFFGGEFFGGEFFNVGSAAKTGTGGIDPVRVGRRIVKPTGILHLPKKEGRKEVADRIDESRDIQAEIAGRLEKEFSEEIAETATLEKHQAAIAAMSQTQIDAEIGRLLKKRKRTEEDEILVLLLIVAAST